MLHARMIIHRCLVDDVELVVRLATLVVVKRDGIESLDWEVVADSAAEIDIELGRNCLDLTLVVGADQDRVIELAETRGEAQVVRYVDRTVVWRGDSPLHGFDRTWLG